MVLSLLVLLASPALATPAPIGFQLFYHGPQADGALSGIYVNGQQLGAQAAELTLSTFTKSVDTMLGVSAQAAELTLSTSPDSQAPEVDSGSAPQTAVEAQAPQPAPAMPSQVPSGGGEYVVVLQQNGQGGQILIMSQGSAGGGMGSMPQVPAQLPQAWSDASRKRSRFRIVVEILEVLKDGPMTPYELGFRLRLNEKRTRKYLDLLEKKGLVERTIQDRKAKYVASAAGSAFVANLRMIFQGRAKTESDFDRDVFSDLL